MIAVYWYTDIMAQVVYAAGINEQLLGDFIRKHNVRDKIFSRPLVTQQMRLFGTNCFTS